MTKLYISPSSQQGNTGPNGYIEEVAMNLIADILVKELLRHGFEVKRNNTNNIYRDHVEESNEYKPDYHIALHSNASAATSSHTARGCVVYCYDPLDVANPGTQLAQNLYKYFVPLTPVGDRGIRSGKLTLSEVARTIAPAVLVEIDFHDNVDGAKWIMAHIPDIAQAYLMGILDQCGVKYIPVPPPVVVPKPIYRVQVGAFYNRVYAESLLSQLQAAGFTGYIKEERG